MSAVVGKDFTVTPSKLIQFDPGTFRVCSSFHVLYAVWRLLGRQDIVQFQPSRGSSGSRTTLISTDEFGLKFCPYMFFYYK